MSTSPAHLSQLREDVRQALVTVHEKLREEELAIEAAILAAHRSARIGISVPMLCQAALSCPGVTLRQAFRFVAIQTGFHEGHVERLYYRKQNRPHVIRIKKETS